MSPDADIHVILILVMALIVMAMFFPPKLGEIEDPDGEDEL